MASFEGTRNQSEGSASADTANEPADYLAGVRAAKQGNHVAAVESFRSSASHNPTHAPSHANLGAALAQIKEYPLAIAPLEQAIRLVPDDINARTNLAHCLHLTGRSRLAVEHAEQVLNQDPSFVPALRTMALSCLVTGNGRKGLEGAARLMQAAPSRDAHEILIRNLMANRMFEDAETESKRYVTQTKRMVESSPTTTEDAAKFVASAELLQGHVLRAQVRSMKPTGPKLPEVRRRREELLDFLLKLVAYAPSADAFFQLAQAHHDLHQHEKAEAALRKSVELDPKNTSALELLGDVLIERSLTEAAVEVLDQALSMNPYQSKALLLRVRSTRDEAERTQFHSKLDQYLAMGNARLQDKINWHFAKGQLFDKDKEYDQAFAHYLKAGRLKEGRREPATASSSTSSIENNSSTAGEDHNQKHDRHHDGSRLVFTPDFFASRKPLGNSSRRPIFVVGVPRSGTTLMEQILASHPAVAGAGELPEVSSFAARCDRLAADHGGYPHGFANVPQDVLTAFAEEYLAQLNRVDSASDRVVDKMPGNLLHVGLIHTLFPNATIIRIRRDPRDVCVSALKNHLDFPLCNLRKTARFCLACDRLDDLWNEVLPGCMLNLKYEELVTDLENNVRRLIEHCGLEWDDRCLEFYRTERNVRTPSRWQVRTPAYSSSIGAWKRYAKDLVQLDDILGPSTP